MNKFPEQTVTARLKMLRTLQLGRAFHFVWQSAKGWTIANGFLLVVQGVLPLLPLYLMKLTVDAVSSGLAAPDRGLVFRRVVFLIGLMGAVTLLNVLTRSIAGLISHRFSTVRMADRIFVLKEGRIIEEGSHEDLVQTGGTYARLFETQARNYR